MARCRLCDSDDDHAAIEHLAKAMWDSRRDEFDIATPWDEAGGTWQAVFRELGVSARLALIAD